MVRVRRADQPGPKLDLAGGQPFGVGRQLVQALGQRSRHQGNPAAVTVELVVAILDIDDIPGPKRPTRRRRFQL